MLRGRLPNVKVKTGGVFPRRINGEVDYCILISPFQMKSEMFKTKLEFVPNGWGHALTNKHSDWVPNSDWTIELKFILRFLFFNRAAGSVVIYCLVRTWLNITVLNECLMANKLCSTPFSILRNHWTSFTRVPIIMLNRLNEWNFSYHTAGSL